MGNGTALKDPAGSKSSSKNSRQTRVLVGVTSGVGLLALGFILYKQGSLKGVTSGIQVYKSKSMSSLDTQTRTGSGLAMPSASPPTTTFANNTYVQTDSCDGIPTGYASATQYATNLLKSTSSNYYAPSATRTYHLGVIYTGSSSPPDGSQWYNFLRCSGVGAWWSPNTKCVLITNAPSLSGNMTDSVNWTNLGAYKL